MRMLIIADTHIPDRAERLKPYVENTIEEHKPYDIVVHVGDLTSESILEWVKSLGKQYYVVEGNMDYLPLPRYAKFEVKGIRFGVFHGHGVYPRGDLKQLTTIARQLEVDILISGHTHAPFVAEYGGVLHLNPGSLTGVWGGGGGTMRPSLIIVEIAGQRLDIVLWEDVGGRMDVTRRASF